MLYETVLGSPVRMLWCTDDLLLSVLASDWSDIMERPETVGCYEFIDLLVDVGLDSNCSTDLTTSALVI